MHLRSNIFQNSFGEMLPKKRFKSWSWQEKRPQLPAKADHNEKISIHSLKNSCCSSAQLLKSVMM